MPKSKKRSRPQVTVVMPVYNSARYLAQSIESVLKQNFDSFELVIYDDGSKDDSCRIAKEYQRRDLRVRVCWGEENRGVAHARNKIVDLARGKYLALHDADDIMLAGRLKRQAALLDRLPDVGVVIGKALTLDARVRKLTGQERSGVRDKKQTRFFSRTGRIKRFSSGPNSAVMLRKELVLEAGGCDERMKIASDMDLLRRLALKTQFYYIDAFFYVYRVHSKSLTARFTRSGHEKNK